MTTREELTALRARALERAYALTDLWTGDTTPTTRADAAEIFADVLELGGWEQHDPEPATLRLVPDGSGR
ncbi:hypothetical protein ACFWTC_03095 [Streptomyces sp. NPDC058619]|uniref:hypothetical protein n=1 Tax=unclassified Streptomyces TaxID=2593676 RepID=UPI003646965C